MDAINKMRAILDAAEGDAEKFFGKGNGAAGTRLRNAMQEIKAMAQDVRVAVSAAKNAEV